MRAAGSKCGFTHVDLIVVLVFLGLFLALLMPGIQQMREADRRASCMNKTKQICMAMQNHASSNNNAFPSAAQLFLDRNNPDKASVGGYSFLVKLLPYLEHGGLYDTLPRNDRALENPNDSVKAALATTIPEFICPDASRGTAEKEVGKKTGEKRPAVTNYKAMGATTRGSLIMVADRKAKPPYGKASLHPDGAIYPSANLIPMASLYDGTSNTIIMAETIDPTASRWMFGSEATLVGLPQKSSPTGDTPSDANFTYFAPRGYDATFGEDSGVAKAGVRTFLSYDFSPQGADAGKYEDPGFSMPAPSYGPSSGHKGVIVCGFGDASAHALSKKIDAGAFFFLITKNGAEPTPDMECKLSPDP